MANKISKVADAVKHWLAAEKERDYLSQVKMCGGDEDLFDIIKMDSFSDVHIKVESDRVVVTYDGTGYDSLTDGRAETRYHAWREAVSMAEAMGGGGAPWTKKYMPLEEDARTRLESAVKAVDTELYVEDINSWSCWICT